MQVERVRDGRSGRIPGKCFCARKKGIIWSVIALHSYIIGMTLTYYKIKGKFSQPHHGQTHTPDTVI